MYPNLLHFVTMSVYAGSTVLDIYICTRECLLDHSQRPHLLGVGSGAMHSQLYLSRQRSAELCHPARQPTYYLVSIIQASTSVTCYVHAFNARIHSTDMSALARWLANHSAAPGGAFLTCAMFVLRIPHMRHQLREVRQPHLGVAHVRVHSIE